MKLLTLPQSNEGTLTGTKTFLGVTWRHSRHARRLVSAPYFTCPSLLGKKAGIPRFAASPWSRLWCLLDVGENGFPVKGHRLLVRFASLKRCRIVRTPHDTQKAKPTTFGLQFLREHRPRVSKPNKFSAKYANENVCVRAASKPLPFWMWSSCCKPSARKTLLRGWPQRMQWVQV